MGIVEPLAIIATSSFFPGAIECRQYWHNILNGCDFISDIPSSHWDSSNYSPLKEFQETIYCPKGGFLPNIPFDPIEFNIPPSVLPQTDTVQLLALVAAKRLIGDIHSLQSGKVSKSDVSIILGMTGGTELMTSMSAKIQTPIFERVLKEFDLDTKVIRNICDNYNQNFSTWTEATFPGLLTNVVAGRIANRLGLKGTNCTVDAACGSSLAGIKMAAQELWTGQADLVITGGCDALSDPFVYNCFSKTPALSRSGDCKPYSKHADGTVLGEGVGLIALRRLSDAERDNDSILAILKGIGSSSDGLPIGIYAPSSEGQALAITRALKMASIDPGEIELIEGHGTGTIAGDKAEFEGLKIAYLRNKEKKQFCALGSVKSQIGHTKSAAGVASVLKAIYSLNHKILPPTIKVSEPNSSFNLESSPFYLNTSPRPWIRTEEKTRKAAVSSFGFGGSNFHVVLEEYKGKNISKPEYPEHKGILVLLHANNKEQLIFQVEKLLGDRSRWYINAKNSQLSFNASSPLSLGFVCHSQQEYLQFLNSIQKAFNENLFEHRGVLNKVFYDFSEEVKSPPEIGFLFPGQGSQYLEMGKDALMHIPAISNFWDEYAHLGIGEEVYPIPVFNENKLKDKAKRLTRTDLAQPAIGMASLGYLRLLRLLSVEPKAVGGHSYGELPALACANVISEEDCLKLSIARGRCMYDSSSSVDSGMLAVWCSIDEIEALIAKTKNTMIIACYNSQEQNVISGSLKELMQLENSLRDEGIKYQRLNVAIAFHSKYVEECAAKFTKSLESITFTPASIPIFSNLHGNQFSKEVDIIKSTLGKQIASPVLFSHMIENMKKSGVQIFLEVAPNANLAKLVQNIIGVEDSLSVISMDNKNSTELSSVLECIGKMAIQGTNVDFNKFWGQYKDFKISIMDKNYSNALVMINGANIKEHFIKEREKNMEKKNLEPTNVEDSNERLAWFDAFKNLQNNILEGHKHFLRQSEYALEQLLKTRTESQTAGWEMESELKRAAPKEKSSCVKEDNFLVQSIKGSEGFEQVLFNLVKKHTGYPVEVIQPEMNLTNDLGIDSIKQLELLLDLQDMEPRLANVDMDFLADMNTLSEIISFVENANN